MQVSSFSLNISFQPEKDLQDGFSVDKPAKPSLSESRHAKIPDLCECSFMNSGTDCKSLKDMMPIYGYVQIYKGSNIDMYKLKELYLFAKSDLEHIPSINNPPSNI